MLHIEVPISPEGWDEEKQEFVEPKFQTLCLEHSLISISKWESKWCKSFINTKQMTDEETLDYVKCMTITQNVNKEVYAHLTRENLISITKYIEAPMTATTVKSTSTKGKQANEIVTSELIYHWMIALNIPFECQKWHLNRLLMLIRVCSAKNQPDKNMSTKDIMSRNKALNAARRKQLNSRG